MMTRELSRKAQYMRFAYIVFLLTACLGGFAQDQPDRLNPGHINPWAFTELGTLPPVAPLNGGVWLKGDLHLHSDHSKDASNNPVSKIAAFAKSVGFDYICITDHDNHV